MASITTTDVLFNLRNMVLDGIITLLETKHLYQHVDLDVKPLQELIESAPTRPADHGPRLIGSSGWQPALPREELSNLLKQLFLKRWIFCTDKCPFQKWPDALRDVEMGFELPTVNVVCECTKEREPHNSGFDGLESLIPPVMLTRFDAPCTVQIFAFPYQCQRCRGEPIVFTVRREDLKLTLVGRSRFELIEMPACLPAEERRFFREAKIAYSAGRTLAGLFYLRTFIEQYWRRILGLPEDEKVDGEKTGQKYQRLLSDDFPKSKYKSLGAMYIDLSRKIHAAEDDSDLFEIVVRDIIAHFDLLKHFDIESPPAS